VSRVWLLPNIGLNPYNCFDAFKETLLDEIIILNWYGLLATFTWLGGNDNRIMIMKLEPQTG
jgi:hypothetical protein